MLIKSLLLVVEEWLLEIMKNQQRKLDFYLHKQKKILCIFIHDEIGYNYRMLNLQAALGTSQIDQLESFIETKIKNYKIYKEELEKQKVQKFYLLQKELEQIIGSIL